MHLHVVNTADISDGNHDGTHFDTLILMWWRTSKDGTGVGGRDGDESEAEGEKDGRPEFWTITNAELID